MCGTLYAKDVNSVIGYRRYKRNKNKVLECETYSLARFIVIRLNLIPGLHLRYYRSPHGVFQSLQYRRICHDSGCPTPSIVRALCLL